MGCAGSGAVAVASRAPIQKTLSQRTPIAETVSGIYKNDFQALTMELNSIARIHDINPVVCLSNESFPVIVSQLFLDDDKPTGVSLPIVAATRFGKGRVAVIGGISIMREANRNRADTELFLSALCQWCMTRSGSVLVCSFADDLAKETKTFLQQLDLDAEFTTSPTNLQNFGLVFASSSLTLVDNDELINYVENGGGLICFFDDGNRGAFNMNHVLVKMGLAFTYCNFTVGGSQLHRFDIWKRFEDVSKLTFEGACESYIEYIKGSDIRSDKLDSLVTFLKFHLIVSSGEGDPQVLPLANHSCELLQRIGYFSDGMFCSEMTHVIVLILLVRLLHMLPKEYMKEFSEKLECYRFPGKCGDVELGTYSIDVDYVAMSWMSTGLWLPAGEIARVRLKQNVDTKLHVQIGSHSESMFSKPGPWKRWPTVTMKYPITNSETEIVSPFGGLIYILGSDSDSVAKLELEFENVVCAPAAVMGQPEIWNTTKDSDVPWCELQSPDFIFTVPTSFVRDHEADLDKIFDIFTRLTHHVIKFTAAPALPKQYRVVFDPEVSDGDGPRYPLVFPLDDLPEILVTENPTLKLIQFVTSLSRLLIRKYSANIDIETETVIATVCACSGILSIWPDSDPAHLLGQSAPLLFKEFWMIHGEYDTLMTKTLGTFQQPGRGVQDSPEDMWIDFFREMCRIAQVNFTSLVQHVRPVPLNVSVSLKKLADAVKIVCK